MAPGAHPYCCVQLSPPHLAYIGDHPHELRSAITTNMQMKTCQRQILTPMLQKLQHQRVLQQCVLSDGPGSEPVAELQHSQLSSYSSKLKISGSPYHC